MDGGLQKLKTPFIISYKNFQTRESISGCLDKIHRFVPFSILISPQFFLPKMPNTILIAIIVSLKRQHFPRFVSPIHDNRSPYAPRLLPILFQTVILDVCT